uniref:chitinase n=1 Tax=Hypocrella siamensis TaxID=696354 RepID=A0A0P0CM87_9HYPO
MNLSLRLGPRRRAWACVLALGLFQVSRASSQSCASTELCGDSEPQRPSCSANSHKLKRVVGYYEEWSKKRPCNQIYPEQIPTGVYTHLNAAFAYIHAETYKLQPRSEESSPYESLTSLKKRERDLKVFIAVGGWAFNAPGPTATIFSDMEADPRKCDTFISSVVDFVNSHEFDGIDIDWEYPGAEDRGGKDEDFANFPVFIAKLKKALSTTTAGRHGVSITLPAYSQYLRHFDMKALEPYVDFFNIMTYDLHGSWDMSNGVGPYLNAHTNLTEVKKVMDLLWRDGVNPDKVVLGLAFYGRTYIMQEPDTCRDPGCKYISKGSEAPCGNEAGVVFNSEIEQVASQTSGQAQLYEDAAVKILRYNHDHWMSFDDEETFAMRVGFAKSQCLGGVMVWAVSHDTSDGRYSLAVGNAVGRNATPGPIEAKLVSDTYGDELNRTGSPEGEGCPTGWLMTERNASEFRDGKELTEFKHCQDRGNRQFCCAPQKSLASTPGKLPRNLFVVGCLVLGLDGSAIAAAAACLLAAYCLSFQAV